MRTFKCVDGGNGLDELASIRGIKPGKSYHITPSVVFTPIIRSVPSSSTVGNRPHNLPGAAA